MATAKIIELNDENTCKICENKLGKYTCPRCNTLYCTVSCYRSAKHADCSETFYKECIMSELSSENSDESKTQVEELLKKFHDENSDMHYEDEDSSMDSDDDDDLPDLSQRLVNIDLDDVEKVWKLLADDEKQEFAGLLQSGDLTKFVPMWTPWWEFKAPKILVQDVDENLSFNYVQQCPIVKTVKAFSEISKTQPADCVKYNLLNVMASYVCVVRYFNGDHFDFHKEAVYLLTSLSDNLQSNANYDSLTSALESVHQLCLSNCWIGVSQKNKEMMYQDVENIMEGPEEDNQTFYLKSALSDMHRLMEVVKSAKALVKVDNEFSKQFFDNELPENMIVSKDKLRNYTRKIEYYLSFITTFINVYE